MKRILLLAFCLILLFQTQAAAAGSTAQGAATAGMPASKTVYDQVADISVTVGLQDFTVYALKKRFTAAPFQEGSVTFAQVEKILPWLGYIVNYDTKKKTLTASSTVLKCTVKAGSTAYTVNGKTLKFSKVPKALTGRFMVPLEELFKSLGYTVQTNKAAKTIRISKYKTMDIGSFALYDKAKETQNFIRLDHTGIQYQALKEITIQQMYAYRGAVIAYVYDRLQRFNKLVRYEKGRFIDLKTNFDIVSTYEFGDSRVFYGYDNGDKKYKLYRFDGTSLILVVDDCYSSVQVNFKDHIILNQYDSNRNYSIVKLDRGWNLTVLDTRRTMVEYFISDNWLYIKAKPQEGPLQHFLVFNGTSMIRVSITANALFKPVGEIDFSDIRVCGDKVYAILRLEPVKSTAGGGVRGKVFRLEESQATELPLDPHDTDFTLIESYNGKLYLSGNYKDGTVKRYANYEYAPGGSYVELSDPKFTNKELMFTKSQVEYGTMFLSGKLIHNVEKTQEDVLYVLRGNTWNYAMDIVSIESMVQTGRGLYLNVKDYDRAKPHIKRDSVLFIDNLLQIGNAAIDFNITHQSVIGNSLVFAGANKITRRSEVNRHDGAYDELIPGFQVSYWEMINGQVFTGGKQDMISSLHRINDTGTMQLRDKFETKSVVATRDPALYLVYGIERDKTSVYNNTQVLYLFDMKKGIYTLMTAGTDIQQILRYN